MDAIHDRTGVMGPERARMHEYVIDIEQKIVIPSKMQQDDE